MALCVDLYCGLGGWAEGFLAEGYRVVGFDNERHDYGTGGYPGWLVLQDVLTIHGSQFRNADVIVGSSPCQEFSYRAMPWKRAKALPPPELGIKLFEAQFRIQREASEAAGRHIPMVVENVRGAEKWVGPAKWHYGSYYLWGDVPAVMPFSMKAQKTVGHVNMRDGHSHTRHLTNQRESEAVKNGGGASWFPISHGRRTHDGTYGVNPARGDGVDRTGISLSRKAASAQIAKIPFPLANWIARVYKPCEAMEQTA